MPFDIVQFHRFLRTKLPLSRYTPTPHTNHSNSTITSSSTILTASAATSAACASARSTECACLKMAGPNSAFSEIGSWLICLGVTGFCENMKAIITFIIIITGGGNGAFSAFAVLFLPLPHRPLHHHCHMLNTPYNSWVPSNEVAIIIVNRRLVLLNSLEVEAGFGGVFGENIIVLFLFTGNSSSTLELDAHPFVHLDRFGSVFAAMAYCWRGFSSSDRIGFLSPDDGGAPS